MKFTKIYLLIFVFYFLLAPNPAQGAVTATLSLSPSTGSYNVGAVFNVELKLNTSGNETHGVDIHYLNFDPTKLEVQDANSSLSGVQIQPGSLYANTLTNSANNTTGKIDFSQTSAGGISYNGQGTLATITLKALSSGTSNVTFNFTLGATTDTNVASNGTDVLSSVTNGQYTLVVPDTTPPSVPTNLQAAAVSQTQINLSWATSTDNVGVIGYKVHRCTGSGCTPSIQIATSTNNSYLNTGLSASTTYRYIVAAYDAAGNISSQSSPASATTLSTADTTSPVISNVSVSDISTSSAVITWATNEPSTSRVEYGTTTGYGNLTTLDANLVTSRSVSLSTLSASTTYHYRVLSSDASNNSATSTDYTFTTSSLPPVPYCGDGSCIGC